MKKILFGSIIMLLFFSVNVFSQQTYLDSTDYWYWDYNRLNLSPEQINKIESLQKKYLENTDPIWYELNKKYLEFDNLITNPTIEPDKIKSIQKEITDLEQKLQEESLDYSLNAKKVLSEEQLYALPVGCSLGLGYGYGAGRGLGFGYMRGGGRGWGKGMGFCRGGAWGQGLGRGMGFYGRGGWGRGMGRGMGFYGRGGRGRGMGRGMGMGNGMYNYPRWR